MTTRSGQLYKDMEQTETHQGEARSSQGSLGSTTPTLDLPSLTQMMQAMIEDRRLREAEIAEDRRRREQENEERMRGMREQINMLQQLVTEREITPRRTSNQETLRLTRLTEQDDIEAYLLTFERMMEAYEIDRSQWSFKLAPQLTGKAQQAYAALNPDEASDYDTLKKAVLRRYNITEETYRRQFRAAKLQKTETPRELTTRLMDMAKKWSKECSTFDGLLDLIVKEQLLNCLPEDIRVWVRERKAKTSAEAGELAEDFLQARSAESEGHPCSNKDLPSPPGDCPRCGLPGHWASECPSHPPAQVKKAEHNPRKKLSEVQCFTCNEMGHYSFKCPKNVGLYCDEGSTQAPSVNGRGVYRTGCVNGMQVEDIILDTGASRTLVREDLIPPYAMNDGEVTITCVHGDTITYPTAQINVSVGSHQDMTVRAAVSKTLPAAVLLGRDVPQLMDLLESESKEHLACSADSTLVLAATTEAQADPCTPEWFGRVLDRSISRSPALPKKKNRTFAHLRGRYKHPTTASQEKGGGVSGNANSLTTDST